MRSEMAGLVPVMSVQSSEVTSIIEADSFPAESMSLATTAMRSYSFSLPRAFFLRSSLERLDSALYPMTLSHFSLMRGSTFGTGSSLRSKPCPLGILPE